MARYISLEEAVRGITESSSESDDYGSDESIEDDFMDVELNDAYDDPSDGELEEQNSSGSSNESSIHEEEEAESHIDEHHAENQDAVLSPSGIQWRHSTPTMCLLGRNIIRFREGTSANPTTELQAFLFFISEPILRTILQHTNRRLRAKKKRKMTFRELKAWLGCVIRAGADHDNLSKLSSLFATNDSRPFYRCSIVKNRMKEILQNVTLDNKLTRRDRQVNDKLAAVRKIWDLFQHNLRLYYTPSDSLTIDEQLYGYRGYVPGRAYMPAKPSKYGIKIFWLCDAANGYALNGSAYSGRDGGRAVGLILKIL